MLSYGYDPKLSEGAVKPPVFLTSTFVFGSAEEGRTSSTMPRGARSRPKVPAPASSTRASTTPTARSSRTGSRSTRARNLRAVFLRHVGDLHDDPGLRPPRRRHPAFPAALRRNRNAAVAHDGGFRHRLRRLRRWREGARRSRRRSRGARQRADIGHHDRDAGQPDQYAGRYQLLRGSPTRSGRPRAFGPSWSATTLCWARCSSVPSTTAPMSRSTRSPNMSAAIPT